MDPDNVLSIMIPILVVALCLGMAYALGRIEKLQDRITILECHSHTEFDDLPSPEPSAQATVD